MTDVVRQPLRTLQGQGTTIAETGQRIALQLLAQVMKTQGVMQRLRRQTQQPLDPHLLGLGEAAAAHQFQRPHLPPVQGQDIFQPMTIRLSARQFELGFRMPVHPAALGDQIVEEAAERVQHLIEIQRGRDCL